MGKDIGANELLDSIEKKLLFPELLALSIDLLLAIALIGLVLNYTPWGIRLEPIVSSLTTYIIVLVFIGSYRKYTCTIR